MKVYFGNVGYLWTVKATKEPQLSVMCLNVSNFLVFLKKIRIYKFPLLFVNYLGSGGNTGTAITPMRRHP